jgi:EAL domain-containing protein (putative c-di-GMP-specific phosphodiesterase class I)
VWLVVEDHHFQRQTLAKLLHFQGIKKVLEADNGKPALDIIRHQTEAGKPIDLVICDIDMPDMDGLELLRHIGQNHPKVIVAICSGKELPLLNAAQLMAREYGVQLLGFIQKPYTRQAVGSLIDRLVVRKFISKPKPVLPLDATFSIGEILHGLNSGQFEPYFQPKLSLQTGAIVGVEALARWHHPERGLIGPLLFINLLEQHKKIDDLTFQMLSKSAQAAKRWQQQGIHVMVSVNLSLVSLTDFSLADKLTQLVFDAGIEPQNMILEITETMAMTEVAPALENLARLRLRGFGLSVDDYGTGFSSLRQLTRAPFTELKIDKSFVTDCANVKSLAAIVKSSIDMAHKLGIESVGEGVESQAVLDMLRVLGCDIAQGYFIAQPMPERDLVKFLQP